MGRKPKISVEEKIFICEQYLNGIKSLGKLAKDNGINTETIRRWINRYREYESNVFQPKAHNRKYTKEFKQEVVEAYLRGEGTPEHLAVKYVFLHILLYTAGLLKYNNLEVFKDYDPKPEVYMKEHSRKTTYEERIEIVKYCLAHNKNYKETAEIFDVSYTQVYQSSKSIQTLRRRSYK